MLKLINGFFIGILITASCRSLFPISFLLVLLAVGIALLFFSKKRCHSERVARRISRIQLDSGEPSQKRVLKDNNFLVRASRNLSILLAGLCLGVVWSSFFAYHILAWELPKQDESVWMTAVGRIASLPEEHPHNVGFVFKTQSLCKAGDCHPIKTKLKLSIYGPHPHFVVGDRWSFPVRLKRPHNYMNPGSFDYEGMLFRNGIRAVGYGKMKAAALLKPSRLLHPRQQLKEGIEKALSLNPLTGVIEALAVGDKTRITSSDWHVLQGTGTSHLMAISGLHIGLVAGFSFFLFNFLWRLSPRLLLFYPARLAATLGGLLIAIFYSALAGFSVPTQRALIMLAVLGFGLLSRRALSLGRYYFIALFLVLFINPFSVLSAGFWLSFSAVALIMYGLSNRLHLEGQWQGWMRMQLVLLLGLAPLTLYFFGQTSTLSLLANMIAIPWVGFLVLPLILIGCLLFFVFPGWATLLWRLSAVLLNYLWFILEKLSGFNLSLFHHEIYHLSILVFAVMGLLLLLAPRGFPGRCWGLVGFLPLIFFNPNGLKKGELAFSLLDVGQGLSAVIQTEKHTLVYDAGPKYSDSYDLGRMVVLPFLKRANVQQLDALVVSHPDNDHSGGVDTLTQGLFVKKLITSEPNYFHFDRTYACQAEDHWIWDDVKFEFVYPFETNELSRNNDSCVLKVSIGDYSILLPGDIEAPAEKILLDKNQDIKPVTVLVAPHHGSKTSSTINFAQRFNPEYVLFPVGYLNAYHFPHKKILARYRRLGSHLLMTSDSGTISFKFTKEGMEGPEEYSLKHSHFW